MNKKNHADELYEATANSNTSPYGFVSQIIAYMREQLRAPSLFCFKHSWIFNLNLVTVRIMLRLCYKNYVMFKLHETTSCIVIQTVVLYCKIFMVLLENELNYTSYFLFLMKL